MKTKEFPTIKQMMNAILFAMCDNNGKCEYNESTHTFIAFEYVPFATRDSGGGIDAVDFEEVVHNITFKEAYGYWVEYETITNSIDTVIPEPVGPYALPCVENYEDWDLPF